MNRMFGTLSGQPRAFRGGFGVVGTLVSLGLCACGAPEGGGPAETTSSVSDPTAPPVTAPGTTPPPGVVPPPGVPVNPPPGNSTPPGTSTPTNPPGNPPTNPPGNPPTNPPGNPPTNPPGVPTGSVPPTPTGTEPGTPPPPAGTCNIAASGEISSKINTVGIVTFTSDVAVTSAKIEFKNMAGGDTFTAPVDLEAEGYRTLLLGMKPSSTYTYKVIVNDNCSSAEGSLTTGNVPPGTSIPRVTKTGSGAYKGFYVVSTYGTGKVSVILDQDGDIVW